MKTPHVDSIGITQYPEGFLSAPRPATSGRRVLALLLAVLFGVTVVATSVVSLGAYCLTSDGGNTRNLPARHSAEAAVDSRH